MLNRFLAGALTLVLGLTGQSMAVARTAPDGSGQMVLCIGATTVVVYVDEDGQPTEAPHICPDCILSFAEPAAPPCAAAPDGNCSRLQADLSQSSLASVRSSVGFLSRAPPLKA